LSAGFSINSFLDYNYDYIEEVRSNDFGDYIFSYNTIHSDGNFRNFSASIAAKPIPNLTVGFSIGALKGEIDQKSGIDPQDNLLNSIRQTETNNIVLHYIPFHFILGAIYTVDERLSVGAVIKLPYTVDLKHEYLLQSNDTLNINRIIDRDTLFSKNLIASTNQDYNYESQNLTEQKLEFPLSLGFGVEYRFKNILEARISADFEYTFWSDFKDDLRKHLNYNDTYAIRVGIEHIFFDKMPFRLGFNYQPLKENKQFTKTVITGGVGMIFDNFCIDFAGGFSSLNTNELDLFDDSLFHTTNPPRNSTLQQLPIDRVETNDFYGMFELKYYFDMPN